MDDERWHRVEEIFERVVEHPPSERNVFLTQACGGDEELRREVESLLAHDVYDTFIQHPIRGVALSLAALSENDLIGTTLGHYRIVGLIGEGGMGAVFAAVRTDELFEQKVAVKLVRRGMDSGFVLERFQAERRILASLTHPNIARLIDGGSTEEGRPYFVMEYIEGRPLNDYCSANDLSIGERIKLFCQICGAVQYAHQKLIAHRDIKPGNILVNDDGIPKLLDFGIAKLLDPAQSEADPARTATMLRLMTPDYASPEQVRGLQVTTATDIYSLGAVLYELLTGIRPHQFYNYNQAEIERIICDTEIERPSQAAGKSRRLSARLRRELEGDLDNIVLMAMRKEPERRYQSVEQLANDLHRHMEKLPVIARPDTIRYRTGKFVRRHKTGIAAVVLIVASLLGGLIATNYQARRAERRFQQVRKLAKTFLFDVNSEVQKLPGSTKARALIIKTSLEYLDNLNEEAGDDPTLQKELAQAYEGIGSIQGYPFEQNLGDTTAALASFQKAMTIYQHLAINDSSNQQLLETICNLHMKIGVIHNDQGNLAEAERDYREAISVIESMYAAKIRPNAWIETAVYYRIGELERLAGDFSDSLQSQKRGFEIATKWAVEHPGDSSQQLLSSSYARLGGALFQIGDLEGALDAHTKSLQVYEDLAGRFPQNVSFRRALASRYQSVGEDLGDPDNINLCRPDEALAYYRKSLVIVKEFFDLDPNDAQAKRNLALSQLWVAMMMRESAPAQAAVLYRKSLALSQALYDTAPQHFQFRHELALAYRGLGTALWRLGEFKESFYDLQQALALEQANFEQAPAKTWLHRGIRRTYTVLGHLLLDQGDVDGALEYYRLAESFNEGLIAIRPNDPHLIRDRADCFKNFGQLNTRLAEQTQLPRQRRISAAREAISSHQRELRIWDEWLSKGIAQVYASNKRREALQNISRIDVLLRRLTASARR
ncbi:MAG: protein kinase [Blastocatellales bacterium]